MKKRLVLCVLSLIVSYAAPTFAASSDQMLVGLTEKWALINYRMADKHQQEEAIAILADEAERFSTQHPGEAAPLIVQANILCTRGRLKKMPTLWMKERWLATFFYKRKR